MEILASDLFYVGLIYLTLISLVFMLPKTTELKWSALALIGLFFLAAAVAKFLSY